MLSNREYLSEFNCYLEWEFEYISGLKGIYMVNILSDSGSRMLEFSIDLRSNTMKPHTYGLNSQNASDIFTEIYAYFQKFKGLNPSYGNIDMGYEIEYDPSESIVIDDFIKYLKSEIRDKKIKNILNEK